MLPTLLFAMLISITLFGCDSGGSASSPSSTASQSTTVTASQPNTSTATNPPPGGGRSASPSPTVSNPPPGGSSASPTAGSASSGGNVKLTVIIYVATNNNPGTSTEYLGILKNDGNVAAVQPMLQVVDDSGHTQDIPTTNGLENAILQPGQSAGFNLIYFGADIKHPQFKASGFAIPPGAAQPAKLSIVSSQFVTSANGAQAVEGEVKNDSDHSATYWMINVIFYDSSGKIVDVNDASNVNAGAGGAALKLEAHSTSKFHIDVTDAFAAASSASGVKATRYDLFVSGFQDP
ncbi:MAG: hypothetical protein DLM69_11460 [Candidatus Chloroheliales bacterium]|nr:MAG: hypothetical protein DLM69_11460 [Chloroflexota bacterium]